MDFQVQVFRDSKLFRAEPGSLQSDHCLVRCNVKDEAFRLAWKARPTAACHEFANMFTDPKSKRHDRECTALGWTPNDWGSSMWIVRSPLHKRLSESILIRVGITSKNPQIKVLTSKKLRFGFLVKSLVRVAELL